MDPLAQLGRLQRLHGVRTLPVQSLHRMSGAQVSELLQFALSLHFAGGGIACASTKDVIRLLGTLELGHLVGDKAHLEPAKNYRNLERAMSHLLLKLEATHGDALYQKANLAFSKQWRERENVAPAAATVVKQVEAVSTESPFRTKGKLARTPLKPANAAAPASSTSVAGTAGDPFRPRARLLRTPAKPSSGDTEPSFAPVALPPHASPRAEEGGEDLAQAPTDAGTAARPTVFAASVVEPAAPCPVVAPTSALLSLSAASEAKPATQVQLGGTARTPPVQPPPRAKRGSLDNPFRPRAALARTPLREDEPHIIHSPARASPLADQDAAEAEVVESAAPPTPLVPRRQHGEKLARTPVAPKLPACSDEGPSASPLLPMLPTLPVSLAAAPPALVSQDAEYLREVEREREAQRLTEALGREERRVQAARMRLEQLQHQEGKIEHDWRRLERDHNECRRVLQQEGLWPEGQATTFKEATVALRRAIAGTQTQVQKAERQAGEDAARQQAAREQQHVELRRAQQRRDELQRQWSAREEALQRTRATLELELADLQRTIGVEEAQVAELEAALQAAMSEQRRVEAALRDAQESLHCVGRSVHSGAGDAAHDGECLSPASRRIGRALKRVDMYVRRFETLRRSKAIVEGLRQ